MAHGKTGWKVKQKIHFTISTAAKRGTYLIIYNYFIQI